MIAVLYDCISMVVVLDSAIVLMLVCLALTNH